MLRIRPLKNPVFLPTKAHFGDAGWDLYSQEQITLEPDMRYQFKLGFAIEGQRERAYIVAGKSGYAVNNGIDTIGNIIDNTYKGEVSAILVNHGNEPFVVEPGMKIAQLIVQKIEDDDDLQIVQKKNLDTLGQALSRGDGGFGSSGKY